jgi:hypothetical protein
MEWKRVTYGWKIRSKMTMSCAVRCCPTQCGGVLPQRLRDVPACAPTPWALANAETSLAAVVCESVFE